MAELTRVELTHPNGRFTVTVDSARAEILKRRGYTPTGVEERPAPKPRARRIQK